MNCVGIFGLLFLALVAALSSVNADCEYSGEKAKPGQEFQVKGECNIYTCHEDGGLTAKTCPVVQAAPNCVKVPQDNSKSFPGCCETYNCPNVI
ncbi:uncharacterized protein LOC128859291 [Anastrepha ludens]|uniref:uncharacterized protein LOC128859291 n=1 Tax=Anastrepha ludens TaxID=28586 RepID=UPI0023B201E2|nr:uncharacterized protein LOC128859291 [Anastrepha ludens]